MELAWEGSLTQNTQTLSHEGLGYGEQRQLPLLRGMGWLALLKGHTLDLEVAICSHVVDGLQVEAVGELKLMPVWQLDGQVSLVKGDAHLHDASGLEREGRLPLFGPPGSAILAVAHNSVGVPMGVEAGVEV